VPIFWLFSVVMFIVSTMPRIKNIYIFLTKLAHVLEVHELGLQFLYILYSVNFFLYINVKFWTCTFNWKCLKTTIISEHCTKLHLPSKHRLPSSVNNIKLHAIIKISTMTSGK